MQIKIQTLTLHNFKGVRDLSLDFGGKSCRIEGDNGTGKSTIFDAFTWVLFGKDHRKNDWSSFDIKPLDPITRKTPENYDCTWVEVALTVDGMTKTLRRILTEDWVKPRGEAERVLKGHTQTFIIDGVDAVTKKAYDLSVASLIDETVFQTITNPLFFIDNDFTKWQDRRRILLDAVGFDPSAVAGDFADLLAEMRGAALEDFRRSVAAAKRAQRADLDKAIANIDAWKAALPDVQDEVGITAEIRQLEARRETEKQHYRDLCNDIDKKIADISEADKARTDEIAAKRAEIIAIQGDMSEYLSASLTAENEAILARKQAIMKAQADVSNAKEDFEALKARQRKLTAALEDYKIARSDEATRLTNLGAQYEQERAKSFSPEMATSCPYCGRPYSAEELAAKGEELRKEWMTERRAILDKIQARVPVIRQEIASWDASISAAAAELGEIEEALKSKMTELTVLDQVLADARTAPEVDLNGAEARARKSQRYLDLARKVAALEEEIKSLAAGAVSTKELVADRQRYVGEMIKVNEKFDLELHPLRDALAVNRERKRLLDMIEAEDIRRAAFADELARLERLEVRTQQYIKASVDACEQAINANFKEARWKMFDATLDGGIVEMCEVTTLAGIPYKTMNDAARIVCGIDVISFLSRVHGVQAPIFIDNAESVTRSSFDTDAQVIRLVVREGSPLTLTAE